MPNPIFSYDEFVRLNGGKEPEKDRNTWNAKNLSDDAYAVGTINQAKKLGMNMDYLKGAKSTEEAVDKFRASIGRREAPNRADYQDDVSTLGDDTSDIVRRPSFLQKEGAKTGEAKYKEAYAEYEKSMPEYGNDVRMPEVSKFTDEELKSYNDMQLDDREYNEVRDAIVNGYKAKGVKISPDHPDIKPYVASLVSQHRNKVNNTYSQYAEAYGGEPEKNMDTWVAKCLVDDDYAVETIEDMAERGIDMSFLNEAEDASQELQMFRNYLASSRTGAKNKLVTYSRDANMPGIEFMSDGEKQQLKESIKKYKTRNTTGASFVPGMAGAGMAATTGMIDEDNNRRAKYFNDMRKEVIDNFAAAGVSLPATHPDLDLYTMKYITEKQQEVADKKAEVEQAKEDYPDKFMAYANELDARGEHVFAHGGRNKSMASVAPIGAGAYLNSLKRAFSYYNQAAYNELDKEWVDEGASGFFKAAFNSATNINELLFNLPEAEANNVVKDLVERKFGKGEELNETEDATLKAYIDYMFSLALRAGNVSMGSDAGAMAGQSAQFAGSMAMGNALYGATTKAAKALGVLFCKSLGNANKIGDVTMKVMQYLRKGYKWEKVQQSVNGIANKAVRGVARVGADMGELSDDLARLLFVEGPMRTATLPTTWIEAWKECNERVNGLDENGIPVIEDKVQDNMFMAALGQIWFGGQYWETTSESSGGVINKILVTPLKRAGQWSRVGTMFQLISNYKGLDVIKGLPDKFKTLSKFVKVPVYLTEKAQVHNMGEEMLEEVFNTFGKYITSDHTEEDWQEVQQFMTLDNWETMFLSFSTIPMTGVAASTTQLLKANVNLYRAKRDVRSVLNGKLSSNEIENVIATIANASTEDLPTTMVNIMATYRNVMNGVDLTRMMASLQNLGCAKIVRSKYLDQDANKAAISFRSEAESRQNEYQQWAAEEQAAMEQARKNNIMSTLGMEPNEQNAAFIQDFMETYDLTAEELEKSISGIGSDQNGSDTLRDIERQLLLQQAVQSVDQEYEGKVINGTGTSIKVEKNGNTGYVTKQLSGDNTYLVTWDDQSQTQEVVDPSAQNASGCKVIETVDIAAEKQRRIDESIAAYNEAEQYRKDDIFDLTETYTVDAKGLEVSAGGGIKRLVGMGDGKLLFDDDTYLTMEQIQADPSLATPFLNKNIKFTDRYGNDVSVLGRQSHAGATEIAQDNAGDQWWVSIRSKDNDDASVRLMSTEDLALSYVTGKGTAVNINQFSPAMKSLIPPQEINNAINESRAQTGQGGSGENGGPGERIEVTPPTEGEVVRDEEGNAYTFDSGASTDKSYVFRDTEGKELTFEGPKDAGRLNAARQAERDEQARADSEAEAYKNAIQKELDELDELMSGADEEKDSFTLRKEAAENTIAELQSKLEKAIKDHNKAKVDMSSEASKKAFKAQAEKIKKLKKDIKFWQDVEAELYSRWGQTKEAATPENDNPEDDGPKGGGNKPGTKGRKAAHTKAGERYQSTPQVEGHKATISLKDGTELPGKYILVEASGLTPSHDANDRFVKHPDFPVDSNGETINDRDYEANKVEQGKVLTAAQPYDGRAVNSVPVVSSEGIVYSGNGRTMAGQLAATNNTDSKYIKSLTDNADRFGFTAKQIADMKHPRVVFELDEELPYETSTFKAFNGDEGQSKSIQQEAIALAKSLSDKQVIAIAEAVDQAKSLSNITGDKEVASKFIDMLIANKVISRLEANKLFKDNGYISGTGKDYIESLLLGVMLDPKQIAKVFKMNNKTQSAIAKAFKPISENYRLGEEFNMRKELDEAIDLLYAARQSKMTVAEYICQPTLEGVDHLEEYSDFGAMLASAIDEEGDELQDLVKGYNAQIALSASSAESLFGSEKKSKEEAKAEVLENLFKYGKYNAVVGKKVQERIKSLLNGKEQQLDSRTDGADQKGDSTQRVEEGNGEKPEPKATPEARVKVDKTPKSNASKSQKEQKKPQSGEKKPAKEESTPEPIGVGSEVYWLNDKPAKNRKGKKGAGGKYIFKVKKGPYQLKGVDVVDLAISDTVKVAIPVSELQPIGKKDKQLQAKNNAAYNKSNAATKDVLDYALKLGDELGLPVHLIERPENLLETGEVNAYRLIKEGVRPSAWMGEDENSIYIYLPGCNGKTKSDISATIFHEGVAHIGLRRMFGDDFDNICRAVWNGMPAATQQRYMNYVENAWSKARLNMLHEALATPEANRTKSQLTIVDEAHRYAADEYIALAAETEGQADVNDSYLAKVWKAFVNWLLGKALPSKGFVNLDKINDAQIRRAIIDSRKNLNKETKTPNSGNAPVNFQLNGDIFYSNASKAVQEVKQDKATPAQWLAMLQKNGGLKAEEDKWLGLSDWLNSKNGSVTKQDILDYIAENSVKIEETHYADRDLSDNIAFGALNDEFMQLVEEAEEETGSLYVAVHRAWAFDEMIERYGEDFKYAFVYDSTNNLVPMRDWDDNLSDATKHFLGIDSASTQPINSTRIQYTTGGLDNNREIALTVPTIEPYNESDEVHFGDAGEGRAVAWVRFGETTDTEGKRVLVIDEIQSKRHQDGREKGYKDDKVIAEAKRRETEAERAVSDYSRQMGEKYNLNGPDIANWTTYATDEEIDEYDKLLDAFRNESDFSKMNFGTIPDAPFQKNWHELAMKRMLRLAAEEGFDKIAWTTGAQQAERYGLEEKIIGIQFAKRGHLVVFLQNYKNGIRLDVDENGIAKSSDERVNGKHVNDIIGKDLFEQVKSDADKNPKHIDVDIAIGGEGMKGFYDQMLPKFMDKYGKKWGVKTGKVTLPYVEEAGRIMHAVDVTPEMKESVMQGQPQFQLADSAARDAAYMKAVESGDMTAAQKIVDEAAKEAGYTIEGYHGTTNKFFVFDRNKANAEGNWGKGFYFSNNTDDVEANYANNDGPDLTARIERLAEQLEYVDDYADLDYEERKEIARKQLSEGEPRTLSTYLKSDNPVVIGGENETYFDMEYDEDEGTESGTLIDFYNALSDIISENEWNRIDLTPLFEDAYDGYSASQLEDKAREILDMQGYQDEDGNMAPGEAIRRAFEAIGHDAIIDNRVNQKFGSARKYGRGMDGMDEDTQHIIVFESNQAKLSDPVTYDENGEVIPLSERFNQRKDDIRFQLTGDRDASTPADRLRSMREALSELTSEIEGIAANQKDDMSLISNWNLSKIRELVNWDIDSERDVQDLGRAGQAERAKKVLLLTQYLKALSDAIPSDISDRGLRKRALQLMALGQKLMVNPTAYRMSVYANAAYDTTQSLISTMYNDAIGKLASRKIMKKNKDASGKVSSYAREVQATITQYMPKPGKEENYTIQHITDEISKCEDRLVAAETAIANDQMQFIDPTTQKTVDINTEDVRAYVREKAQARLKGLQIALKLHDIADYAAQVKSARAKSKNAETSTERAEAMGEQRDAKDRMIQLQDAVYEEWHSIIQEGRKRRKEQLHRAEIDNLIKQARRAVAYDLRHRPAIEDPMAPSGSVLHDLAGAPARSMEYMLNALAVDAPAGEGELYKLIFKLWSKARNQEIERNNRNTAKMNKAVNEIFKGKYDHVNELYWAEKDLTEARMWNGPTEPELQLSVGQLAMIYAWSKQSDAIEKLAATHIFVKEIPEKPFSDIAEDKLTKEQKKARAEWDNTYAHGVQLSDLMSHLPNEWKQWMDFVQSDMLAQLRDEYAPVYEARHGRPMPNIKNYFPFAMTEAIKVDDQALSTIPGALASLHQAASAEIDRIQNNNRFTINNASAMGLLATHIDEMERVYNYNTLTEVLKSIVGNRQIAGRMKSISPHFYKDFVKACQVVTGLGYNPDKEVSPFDYVMGRLTQNIARTKIAAKTWTAYKQFESALVYMDDILSSKEFAKAFFSPKNWIESMEWAYETLPQMKERWDSKQLGDQLMNTRFFGKSDTFDKARYRDPARRAIASVAHYLGTSTDFLSKMGMLPNAAVDFMTCSLGAKAKYDQVYKHCISLGMSEDAARNNAIDAAQHIVNRSQQSQEAFYISPFQMSSKFLNTFANVFRNSAYAYGRLARQSVKDWKKYVNNKEEFLESAAESARSFCEKNGITDQEAIEREIKYRQDYSVYKLYTTPIAVAAVVYGWDMVPVGGWLFGALANGGGGGDDDKISEEYRKSINDAKWDRGLDKVLSAVTTSTINMIGSGIPYTQYVASTVDAMNKALANNKSNRTQLEDAVTSSFSPIEMTFSELSSQGSKLNDRINSKDAFGVIYTVTDAVTTMLGIVDLDVISDIAAGCFTIANNTDASLSTVAYGISQILRMPKDVRKEFVYTIKTGEDIVDATARILRYAKQESVAGGRADDQKLRKSIMADATSYTPMLRSQEIIDSETLELKSADFSPVAAGLLTAEQKARYAARIAAGEDNVQAYHNIVNSKIKLNKPEWDFSAPDYFNPSVLFETDTIGHKFQELWDEISKRIDEQENYVERHK